MNTEVSFSLYIFYSGSSHGVLMMGVAWNKMQYLTFPLIELHFSLLLDEFILPLLFKKLVRPHLQSGNVT